MGRLAFNPGHEGFEGCLSVMDATLARHLKTWEEKDSLRFIYEEDIFKRVEAHLLPGQTLEIGSGPGFFKKSYAHLISSDILHSEDLDVRCRSSHLPFREGSLTNIVGIDVLHHLERPGDFFKEVGRVLKPGGRLILIEPWITPLSRLVYTFIHHEECRSVEDPFGRPFETAKDPWLGNSMLPYQIFSKKSGRSFESQYPQLRILIRQPFSAFAYPLTGGFQPYGIRSKKIVGWLLKMETVLQSILMPLFAFRILVVIEKLP